MTKAMGVMAAGFNYSAAAEDEFNDWYDTEHIPEHQMQKLGRFVGEQLVPGRQAAPPNAGGLLFFAMNVEAAAEAEFNQWYDTEHLPALAAVPGCLCARRFKTEGSATQKYFAIYHLTSPDIATGKPWKAAVATPWTGKILKHTSAHLSARLRRYVRAG